MISPSKEIKQENGTNTVSTPCTQSHAPRLTSSAPSFETRKAAWNGDSSSPEFHGMFGSKWLRNLDGDLSTNRHRLNAAVDPSPYMDPDFPEEWRHFSYTQSDEYRADFVNAALAARSCPEGGEFDFDPVAQCVLFCPQYVQPLADDAGNATKTYINEIARTWQHSGDLEEYEIKDKKHAYAYAVPGKVVNAVRGQLSPAAAKYLAQAWQIITFSDNPDNAHDATAIRYKWFDEVEGRYVDVTNDDIEKIIPRLRPGITSKQALRSVSTLILSCARVVTQVRDGNLIYCAGGDQVLDLTQYGTGVFASTPDPGKIAVNVLPWRYDPSVYSADGDRFLDSLANHDPEIRRTLEEVGGTCMSSGEAPLVFLVGDLLAGDGREKANGKTTFADTIRTVVGHANATEFKIRDYASRFGKVVLRDKLVVTDSDMSSEMVTADTISELKVASGGRDLITSDVKNEKPITFPATHTQLVASNTLPTLPARDLANGAMDRRWNFVPFLNYFDRLPNGEMSPERDSELVERILGTVDGAVKPDPEAMSYIFTCFIDGLMRYRAQGRKFTESDYSRRVRRQIQLNNNSILNWVYSSDTPFTMKMFLDLEANPEVNEACLDGEARPERYGARRWMTKIPAGVSYNRVDEDKVLVSRGTTACVSAFYAAYQRFCDSGGYYKVSRKYFKSAMHTLFGLNESPRVIRTADGSVRSARIFLLDPQFESYAQGLSYLRGDRWYESIVQAPEVPDDFDPLSVLDPKPDPDPDTDPDGPGGGTHEDVPDDVSSDDAEAEAMQIAVHDVPVTEGDVSCDGDDEAACHVVAPYAVMEHLHRTYKAETGGSTISGESATSKARLARVRDVAEQYLARVDNDDFEVGDHELDERFVEHLSEAAGSMCAEDEHALDALPASLVATPEQRKAVLMTLVQSAVLGARNLAADVRACVGDDGEHAREVRCAYRALIVDVLRYEIARLTELIGMEHVQLATEFHHVVQYWSARYGSELDDVTLRRLHYLVMRACRDELSTGVVSIDEVLGTGDASTAA